MGDAKDISNPFDEYGLDPALGVAGITARLRELMEEAETDRERRQIREAWMALTKHPRRRLELSLSAAPQPPAPLRAPRPRAVVSAPMPAGAELPFVPFAACLDGEGVHPQGSLLVPLSDDPLLSETRHGSGFAPTKPPGKGEQGRGIP